MREEDGLTGVERARGFHPLSFIFHPLYLSSRIEFKITATELN
jgi:hypothetical protein